MSRRKQLNPKPIKRDADEEEDLSDKIISSAEDSSNQSDGDKNESESEKDLQERTGTIEVGFKESSADDGNVLFTNNEVFNHSNFPNDVLCIKKLNEDQDNVSVRQWSVCTAIPLQKSSSIGPICGEIVSPHDIKFGEVVIQFRNSKDDPTFVKVTDDSGSWLALLQSASDDTPRNTHVYYEGGRVWCEVVSDLELGAEMVASFTIQSEEDSTIATSPSPMEHSMTGVQAEDIVPNIESMETSETDRKAVEQADKQETKNEAPKSPKAKSSDTAPRQKADPPAHAALIYGCPFCSVRFSSLRTLEGHLAYYCSKKPPDFVAVPDLKGPKKADENEHEDKSKSVEQEVNGEKKLKRLRPSQDESGKQNENENNKSKECDDSSPDNVESPPSKSLKLKNVFRCPYCSYSADKLSSLNRHRRIHNRSSIPDNEKPIVLTSVSRSETYCTSCNIQFSSIGTYSCHKEHYCSKREQQTSSPDSTDSDNSQIATANKSSTLSPSHSRSVVQIPAADLLQQQVMLGLSATSFIPGQTTVILAAPIVATNGVKSMAFGMPTVIVQPVMAALATSLSSKIEPIEAHQGNYSTAQAKLSPAFSSEQPLDLSTSKNSKRESVSPSEKEGKTSPLMEPESNLKCIKAEPKSPIASPECRKTITPTSPKIMPTVHSPQQHAPLAVPKVLPTVFPFNQVTPPPMIPPLPHSVSKCMECNIVFYKHENYMIHKEHYCSSRRTRSESPKEVSSFSSCTTTNHTVDSEAELSQPDQTKSPQTQSVNSPVSPSVHISSPTVKDGVVYRFYCIPCKIKFSSASTLKAHKEFYCPHGKESDKVVFSNNLMPEKCDVDNSETVVKSEEEGQFKCKVCGGMFTSSRLLKLHLCIGLSTQVPLLRCPCCDFVTQTEIRLSDHMKVHVPTKAYKCSLCGYRGNTVRGMRMHGKMHIDNGEPFSDDNMTEFEEPPLVPIQLNGHSDNGPLDVEAELIRLKNEPYKRRRSRKSYDKSEHAMHIVGHPVKSVCSLCCESFSDVNNFLIHMRLHEMAALEMAKSLKCRYCETILPSIDCLIAHIQNIHGDTISPKFSVCPTSYNKMSPRSDVLDSDNSETNLENTTAEKMNAISVKQESPDSLPDDSSPPSCNRLKTNSPVCNENNTNAISNKVKENLGIDSSDCSSHSIKSNSNGEVQLGHSASEGTDKYFSIQNSPMKGSKNNHHFEVKSDPDENSVSSCSTIGESTFRNSELDHIKNAQTFSPTTADVNDPHLDTEPIINNVKSEVTDNMTAVSLLPKVEILASVATPMASVSMASPQKSLNAHSMTQNISIFGAQTVLSLHQMPHGVANPTVHISPNQTKNSETLPSVITDEGANYCKQCDIKFTYQSSFLAHKKYYCSGRTTDNASPSATA